MIITLHLTKVSLRLRNDLEMMKWFVHNFLSVLLLLDALGSFCVDSCALSENDIHSKLSDNEGEGNKKAWELLSARSPIIGWGDEELSESRQQLLIEGENEKWPNVVILENFYNLFETDNGPEKKSKLNFLNSEDHLKLFGSNDKEENRTQLQENISVWLNSESFLSQILAEKQSKDLERAKREADDAQEERKICRCRRRRGRRTNFRRRRRRRRRRRNGQQGQRRRRTRERGRRQGTGRRRRGRRRGRRRCICRKKNEGRGNSGDEESKGDGVDGGDDNTTEGWDESSTEGGEGGGEEGGGEEGGGEGEEGDEEEGGDEGEGDDGGGEDGDGEGGGEEEGSGDEGSSDEEDSEEKREGDNPPGTMEGLSFPMAPGVSVPPGSIFPVPGYMVPYTNIPMMPISGQIPIGTIPQAAIPNHYLPSRPRVGTLLQEKRISKAGN